MSSFQVKRQRQDAEAKAQAAERKAIGRDGSHGELEAVITAAELYMKALRLSENADDRKRLDGKTKQLILKAEELKSRSDGARLSSESRLEHPVSTRTLTTRENIILLESGKLNGAIFKPWIAPPADDEFALKDGQKPFADVFEFSLSETQRKHFDSWQRPKEALSRIDIYQNAQLLSNEATMEKLGTWDMVQDVAPDCSVVASFCVGAARAEKGHKRLFGQIVWPYDHAADRPSISSNGRYVFRLYFNGCWRRVEIDDWLPTSKTSRILHVIDRSHPGLIWPAVVEKAYLKVRGGYDFPGSNSGTDLAVLTGWIPQQIFLHHEDVEPNSLWEELYPAFVSGEIMCTLGTGKLGRREQLQLGLGAEHDYAVLELKETDNMREMLIKNPWVDGDVWKGATKSRPNIGHEKDSPTFSLSRVESEAMKPGTFWMDFNHVFQYFEHLYLNWNPGMFKYREDMHFTWHLPQVVQAGNLFVDHPQFAIRAREGGDVWILLNRHFRTGDYSVQNHGRNGYISLYLFDKHGGRVFSSEDAKIKGPFVDSPNTLLKLRTQCSETYTLVVVGQDLPVGKYNFTISAFSNMQLELSEAFQNLRDPQTLTSAWTRSTAGGSADSSRYLQNPQFALRLVAESRIVFVLKSLSDESTGARNRNIHVKVLIASSNGKRITKMTQRDVVAHSGDYKRGAAVIEATLQKGMYTVICSTFKPNQLSKFEVNLYTTIEPSQTLLRALPAEGSGRLSIMPQPAFFTQGVVKVIAPMKITRVTKAMFKASLVEGPGSSVIKMSLEQGQGPYKQCIRSSATEDAEYSAVAAGLRIEDIDLGASMAPAHSGGLWLVLEKPEQASTDADEMIVLQVEILSEERIEIGAWAPLQD